jgi:hypothetical protein
MVRKRHAIQFECEPNKLTITDMGGDTYLVTGCGPRSTYVCKATGSVYDNECYLESVAEKGGDTHLPKNAPAAE